MHCKFLFGTASWILKHKVQSIVFVFLIGLWAFHLEEVVRVHMIPNRENLELRLFPHDAAIPRMERPSDELYHPLNEQDEFTIVTAGSHGYMDRLENMIGSIHFYEPNVNIVVVDVGLSAAQRAALSCLDQVSVIPFDFLRFPDHVRHLDNYAWKPILIKQLYEDYPNGFLYMDSGCELWASLKDMMSILRRDGYFFTVQETAVSTIHPATIEHLKVSDQEWEAVKRDSHLWAGLMALSKKYSPPSVIEQILHEWNLCAIQQDCIMPNGADLSNHKYDQSVLSLLVRVHQHRQSQTQQEPLKVHKELRWWLDWFRAGITGSDEEAFGGHVQFFSRRYHCPKPYKSKLRYTKSLSECLAEHGQKSMEDSEGGWYHPLLFRGGNVAERRAWRCPEKINLAVKATYHIVAFVGCFILPEVVLCIVRRRRGLHHELPLHHRVPVSQSSGKSASWFSVTSNKVSVD